MNVGGPCKGCGKQLVAVYGPTFCHECVENGKMANWLAQHYDTDSFVGTRCYRCKQPTTSTYGRNLTIVPLCGQCYAETTVEERRQYIADVEARKGE